MPSDCCVRLVVFASVSFSRTRTLLLHYSKDALQALGPDRSKHFETRKQTMLETRFLQELMTCNPQMF